MYEFSRRAFLKGLGKVTAGLGVGLSLGAGCAKEESDMKVEKKDDRRPMTNAEIIKRARSASPGGKKIIALSCGSENGQNETFIRAAAIGAAEFGIETELIRAATLDVNVLEANKYDDVPWIHEKTLLEDAALICAVPCYHVRANSLFYAINERMNQLMREDQFEMNKKTRVGAVICVGGSGYDDWASLTKLSTQIFMQHTRVVVDQMLVTFSAFREWNLWMQQGKPLTSNTHKQRITDTDYEETRTMWGEQPGAVEFYKLAIERAKELGRNVARAMNMPIEEVKYVGEEAGVSCPLCHCSTFNVPEDLPYIYCPVCAIRGTIVIDNGKMKVDWNIKDLEVPRFCVEGEIHHFEWLRQHSEKRNGVQDEIDTIKDGIYSDSPVKIISPYA